MVPSRSTVITFIICIVFIMLSIEEARLFCTTTLFRDYLQIFCSLGDIFIVYLLLPPKGAENIMAPIVIKKRPDMVSTTRTVLYYCTVLYRTILYCTVVVLLLNTTAVRSRLSLTKHTNTSVSQIFLSTMYGHHI